LVFGAWHFERTEIRASPCLALWIKSSNKIFNSTQNDRTMQRVSPPKRGAAEPVSHRLGKWIWCRKLSALPKQKD